MRIELCYANNFQCLTHRLPEFPESWIIICFTAFIDVFLRDAKYVQEAFLSLMQNETFAKAWADHAMDSIVQTVAKVGQKSLSLCFL